MGVVHPHSMGLGGGVIMTVYDRKSKEALVFDGREVAPAAISKVCGGKFGSKCSQGGKSVAVPGELRTYWEAHREFGKLPWADLVKPAIRMCEVGVPVSGHLGHALGRLKNFLKTETPMKEIFWNKNTGDVLKPGDLCFHRKLGQTLEIIAERGGDELYTGELANLLVQDIQRSGGVISVSDMAEFKPRICKAITIPYRSGHTMLTAPPPSAGVVLAHILQVLEGYGFTPDSVTSEEAATETVHLIAETYKYAFVQRAKLADPNYVDVNSRIAKLISPDYAANVRQRIHRRQTFAADHYGPPIYSSQDSGTAHLSLIAPSGDAVSATSTVNTWLGSGVRSPQTGIILNNEMDDFSYPNVVNHFGVHPSPYNSVSPGKKPMSSMCPSIFTDTTTGEVALVIGAAGGTRILTAVSQVAMRVLFLKEDIKTALDTPRLHHQLLPDELQLESGFPERLALRLQRLGHKVHYHSPRGSAVVGIHRGADGVIYTSPDFRKDSGSAGF